MAVGGRRQRCCDRPTLVVWLVALCWCTDIVAADFDAHQVATHPTTSEFSKHAQLKPRIYHGREKRQISSTREETSNDHVHHITVDYDLDDENYILDLRLNDALVPQGYFVRTQENGRHTVNRPKQEEVELCHYHGRVRDRPKSWVALSTCNDTLRGVVYDGTEIHYVEHHDGEHRAYKHSDYTPMGNRTCGYAGGPHNDDHDDHEHSVLDNRILRYKRSTTETLVRGPYNANKQSRYVELVFVVDNRQFKELDENVKVVEHHCKDIANIINAIYSPLNIYIALVGVVIWTDFDEIVFSSNGDTTLTNFLHYRRETLIKEHPNDNAQLLTKFTFDNGVVGKALKGPICTYEYSGGVNTEHSNVLGLVATTVAHEMGHNFGMEHDTNECSCADEKCIMAPSSSPIPPTHWSSCSLDYLALAFEHGMDYCLRNKPARLFDSPVCGNGFVEPGEQCDCGLPEHCDNTCCNATACMLYANASCATGECCDLATCMPKNAGTMCRSADYECDLPEYCTGQSEYCPDDIYKMDTESCDNGRAYCYHGFCRTRSDQCKLLWGNTGKSSDDQCYKMNTKGTRHGNCGYNKLNQSYFRCNDENVMCGMLHCKHLNERLEFGMESVAILSHSFINLKGSIIPCRTAIVDLGLNQVDPGLAPDGAICGEGRMCVNQKCMAVDSLRLSIGGCPNDCNGHGVCNSMGHCHCENGFAPPDCEYPGPGGSADSGPAEDPNRHRVVVNAMFIFFLGIVPLVTLCGFAYYYIRHNMGGAPALKKSPATQKSPPKTRSPPFSPESPKKAAEDNHCLLSAENSTQDDFFGQFKGYSITPIKKSPSRPEEKPLGVVRPAPQVPKIAAVAPTVKRTNTIRSPEALPGSMVSAPIKGVATTSAEPPALPPLNPGAHPRPIISSPTLQNSTCTAKELISPLRNAPKVPTTITQEGTHRVAPAPPIIALKEVKIEEPAHVPTPQVTFAPVTTSQLHLGKEKKTALNRIASFLKPEKKSPKVPKPFIEKDLRSVDISGPIPQADRPTPEKPVARSHSMKTTEPITKPKLQSFGSMRDPSKRPVSMVGSRPKSPPPPAPNVNAPEATPPKNKALSQTQNQYDDCLNAPLAQSESTSPSSDNIYAVIEDNPVSPASPASLQSPQSPPSKNASNSTSNESFGLLGEIVSEIQNRNFDSIYSTSTLARKKKERERAIANGEVPPDDAKDAGPLYENTQNIQDPHDTESVGTAEGEYSNMSRAYENSASSTSSGYIHPSAVNRPKYDNPIVSKQPPSTATEAKALASFKKPTSSASMVVREAPRPPVAPTTQNTPAAKTPPTTQVTRQVTPTNLKTRKASPTRPKSMVGSAAAAAKPQTSVKPSVALNKPATTAKPVISGPKGLKTTSNSPDLVSCSTPPKSATQKAPPDVLNGAKKPLQTKKSAGKLTAATVGGANSVTSSASKGKIFPVKNSTVASLQQKFENKT